MLADLMTAYRRDPKRTYRSSLRKLVSGEATPASKPLPLTHVTDSIRLPAILQADELRPLSCPVFGDMRLYAFYARPAYRSPKEGPLHNLNFAPVCFIIDPTVVGTCPPVAVFPFDTGALKRGLLDDEVHTDLGPHDFALDPSLASAQRLAKLFFGDERSYYSGRRSRQAAPKYSALDAEIVAYDSLIQRGGNTRRDERVTSIEFHFKDPLPLAGRIIGLILPQEFLDVPEIRQFIKQKKIDPIPYIFHPDHTVKEVAGAFYAEAENLYKRKKRKYGWDW